jgi:hypothetical protein
MKPRTKVTHEILARRVREVRRDLFGEHGGALLAEVLDLPPRTWANYEAGVSMPAAVLLRFVDATEVNPRWLLTGQGPKFGANAAALEEDRGIVPVPWGLDEPSPG